jgi:hypothetical protein
MGRRPPVPTLPTCTCRRGHALASDSAAAAARTSDPPCPALSNMHHPGPTPPRPPPNAIPQVPSLGPLLQEARAAEASGQVAKVRAGTGGLHEGRGCRPIGAYPSMCSTGCSLDPRTSRISRPPLRAACQEDAWRSTALGPHIAAWEAKFLSPLARDCKVRRPHGRQGRLEVVFGGGAQASGRRMLRPLL